LAETHRDDLDHDKDKICHLAQKISPRGFRDSKN
jgi:hypothetical protein